MTEDAPTIARPARLSPGARVVLAAIIEEPGERTVPQLAADLGLPRAEVARHAHQLSRRGLVAPRLVRLHPWATLSAIENDLERCIYRTLKKCPRTRADLAVAVMRNPTDGDFRRALKRLDDFGSISLPAAMDPSEAGRVILGAGGGR